LVLETGQCVLILTQKYVASIVGDNSNSTHEFTEIALEHRRIAAEQISDTLQRADKLLGRTTSAHGSRPCRE
jgi:hypothetical protein